MKKNSVETKIANRLKGFVDSLKQGEPIAERFTCRTIVLKLQPTAYKRQTIPAIRKLLNVSQGVFAQFLGVSVNTIRSWEQGINTPSDLARRFLDEIQMNPDYWRKRLQDSIEIKSTTLG